MGTTGAPWLLPYPELTDPPDGPAQIKALATAVDTALDTLDTRTADTGRVNPIAGTYQTGWALANPIIGRRHGPFCVVEFSVKRTGTALTSPATGNIADSFLFQFTDVRFKSATALAFQLPIFTNLGAGGGCWVDNTGMVTLQTWTANAVINTNDILTTMLTYAGL